MHVPCPACGSSDAAWRYEDGHRFCHKCSAYFPSEGGEAQPQKERRTISFSPIEYTPCYLPKRGLSEETCRFWEYGTSTYGGKPVQVATYRTPDGSRLAGQKIRFQDKEFLFLGSMEECGLYGQHKWKDGGKKVVVTEGEIDAMSVGQVQSNKWPVVSVPNGANGAKKALTRHIEWLEKFEEVILMFDMDEPGREAAKECVELFTPGKCKVAELPLKDANEMLQANRGSEIVNSIWNAKTLRPDGIVAGSETWEVLTKQHDNEAVAFPCPKLQTMTEGWRKGELLTILAGSGVGKTEVTRWLYYSIWEQHPQEKIGLLHLEESLKRTVQGILGLKLKKRTHLKKGETPEAELKQAHTDVFGSDRFYLYEHFGSTDSENLFAKMKYLAKGCGCSTIILDHLSIVVSGMSEGDERRLIDNIVTRLATLAQELKVRVLAICHLRKPSEGQSHEEGRAVKTTDARGSHSIIQLSHTCLALERNQQSETEKHFTQMRVLKCRETGETGLADRLKYDPETGLFSVVDGEAVDWGSDNKQESGF